MLHNAVFRVLQYRSSAYKVSIRISLLRIMSSKMMSYDQVVIFGEYTDLGIKEYSEWPTIPQLYLNGEFVGGCDIVMNMHQNGELEKMLDEAGVLVPYDEAEHKATEGEEPIVGQGVTNDIGSTQGDQPDGKRHDVKE